MFCAMCKALPQGVRDAGFPGWFHDVTTVCRSVLSDLGTHASPVLESALPCSPSIQVPLERLIIKASELLSGLWCPPLQTTLNATLNNHQSHNGTADQKGWVMQ